MISATHKLRGKLSPSPLQESLTRENKSLRSEIKELHQLIEADNFSEDVRKCLRDLNSARHEVEWREANVQVTMAQLKDALGIDLSVRRIGFESMRSHAQTLIDRLDRDKEIARLKDIIEQLRNTLDIALTSPLPEDSSE